MGTTTEDAKKSRIHDFDIDTYLNPYIPRPRFHYLPHIVSRFFGYRPPPKTESAARRTGAQPSALVIWAFSFLGAFIGISIIENVYLALPRLDGKTVPVVIGSFGAAAILEYNTIESPLSQPRNLVLGHFLSALVGVSITKLFELLPPERFEQLRWLAGALAVGTSSVVMGVTKTIHPPAGATALLAATSPDVTDLGWWLLAIILLGCMLMLVSAMIVNNIFRRFPLYWWTPANLSELHKRRDTHDSGEVERSGSKNETEVDLASESDATYVVSHTDEQPTSMEKARRLSTNGHMSDSGICITSDGVHVPHWVKLTGWERNALETFCEKLRRGTVSGGDS